jgi:spermidine/putrescine transport system substrate-binding protein
MRRLATITATIGFAAALLAGCTRQPENKTLNLFAWSEYVPQAVIDGFTKETGIQVNYESYASNEEMLAKLVSGAEHYDLIQPSEYAVEALVKEHRLMPIDWAKVPNIKNIAPQYTHQGHDPEQRYTVPWMAGSVGIVVNTAKVNDPIAAYRDVFQDKFRGRIVIVDDPREIVAWALTSIGKGPNDVTAETLAQVKPVLAGWLPLVKVYDSDSPKTALLNGDVDLGVVWSGEAALLYKENPQFKYVLPAEGAHGYIDSLAIPTDAANPDGAMQFMNYILRPEVSRQISAEFPYTNPNLAARALLTPQERQNPASYPPGDPTFTGLRDIGAMAVPVDKLVTDLKAGT